MDSLATVLRRIPIFADLPPGTFAKVIADLREESHPPGTVLCFEGDPAHDFFIVKSGECDVLVNQGWNRRELIAVTGPNQWFGERALFSDRARSATVVARTELVLWRLTKEKFDNLIEENPWLIRHFTQVIGDRLYETNQQLSKLHAAFTSQMLSAFEAQPPHRQEFLKRTAILTSLDPPVIRDLVDSDDTAAALAAITASGAFVAQHDGVFTYLAAVRDFLLSRLTAEVGREGLRQLHGSAAGLYLRERQLDQAIGHYIEAEEFGRAAELIAGHADAVIAAKRFEVLRGWLDSLPDSLIADVLPDLRTRMQEALRAAEPGVATVARPRPLWEQLPPQVWQWTGAVAGIGAGLAIWNAPVLEGLTTGGMRMLALLAWAVIFWAFDVLPDYVVGLGMIIGWIGFGIVPAQVAVSGFTTSPFFLIIGVLGIAASLQSSGLLFRLALQILRRFPLTYRGQALGLAISGTAVSSCIPDVTSGVALAGPIILALSDSLGYARRSRGSAGLAMAAVLGFGQMSPFFLTGAAENLLSWGLLPAAARTQITWGGWFLAALPMALVTFSTGFAATLILLPPEFQPTTSRGLIDTQIEALGRSSRAEWINGIVLLAAVVGWVTAPVHGIDVAWVAMGGMALLLGANLLDRSTFRAGIYWDFLFYLAAVLSLTGVVQHLKVDTWVVHQLAPLLQPVAHHPARFLPLLALAVFAARFIMPSLPLVSLLTVTIIPIAMQAGIGALALVLVICTSVTVWFLPYQSTYYLALYFSTKEKAFTHGQVRLLAWTYGVIYLLAILVAIPYWRMLGLIP